MSSRKLCSVIESPFCCDALLVGKIQRERCKNYVGFRCCICEWFFLDLDDSFCYCDLVDDFSNEE